MSNNSTQDSMIAASSSQNVNPEILDQENVNLDQEISDQENSQKPAKYNPQPISHPHIYTLITGSGEIDETCLVYLSFFVGGVTQSLKINKIEVVHKDKLPESYHKYCDDYYCGLRIFQVENCDLTNMLIECFISSWNSYITRFQIYKTDTKYRDAEARLEAEFSQFCRSLSFESFCSEASKWDCYFYAESCEMDEDEIDLENLDQVIRKRVRSTTVPMIDIPPLSSEILKQISELRHIFARVDNVHSTPLIQGSIPRKLEALKTLMGAEFRASKNRWPIGPKAIFIHSFEDFAISDYTKCLCSEEDFLFRLTKFVGSYLPELDLSNSYITGSAIPACLYDDVRFGHNRIKMSQNEIALLCMELFYPIIYTEFEPSFDKVPPVHPDKMSFHIESATSGICTIEDNSYPFKIVPAVDVDIAVDSELSEEDYLATAQSHINCIRKHYPFVKVEETVMPKGSTNYRIYTDDPAHITTFRQVEIYRTTFSSICCHHVGVVRGAFTAKWSEAPQLYITSSALYTFYRELTPNYNYFASRKNKAQDIILKYQQRGFSMEDRVIESLIEDYTRRNNIKVTNFPFYTSRGLKFNILGAASELKLKSKYDTLFK